MFTYLVLAVLFAFLWDGEPAFFNVHANASRMLKQQGHDAQKPVTGYTSTAAIIHIAETLLHKPGGYLSNDIMPPGILMDNIPSWERGVIIQLRDVIRALRNDFSRDRSQSPEFPDLVIADAQIHFNPKSWILPETEAEYQKGIDALKNYLIALKNNPSLFSARADNLNIYLATVEKRLGGYTHRLSTNIRELQFTPPVKDDATLRKLLPGEILESTPWLEIDNVFYEARGYAWALLHIFKAIEVDFAEVLDKKVAGLALQRIIHKLKSSQDQVWSPVIMNNSGLGIFTNHSLVIASYLGRASAALNDLRRTLLEG